MDVKLESRKASDGKMRHGERLDTCHAREAAALATRAYDDDCR